MMQRAQAIELLCNMPEVELSPDTIEDMADHELYQWLWEMGYDWDGYEWVADDE